MSVCQTERRRFESGRPLQVMLYRVDVPHFCCGIIVKDEKVVKAAPIMKWAVGKPLTVIQAWVKSKRGTILLV